MNLLLTQILLSALGFCLWFEAHRHNTLRRELVQRGLISNVVGDATVADWAHWKLLEENEAEAAADAASPPNPPTGEGT